MGLQESNQVIKVEPWTTFDLPSLIFQKIYNLYKLEPFYLSFDTLKYLDQKFWSFLTNCIRAYNKFSFSAFFSQNSMMLSNIKPRLRLPATKAIKLDDLAQPAVAYSD